MSGFHASVLLLTTNFSSITGQKHESKETNREIYNGNLNMRNKDPGLVVMHVSIKNEFSVMTLLFKFVSIYAVGLQNTADSLDCSQ